MAKRLIVMPDTYLADAAIAGEGQCLVASTANVGNVMLPAAAQALHFIGVSREASDGNGYLAVTCKGRVPIRSDGSGTITAGQAVEIADTTGRIRQSAPAVPSSPGTQGNWHMRGMVGIALNTVAATADLLVDVLLQPYEYFGA